MLASLTLLALQQVVVPSSVALSRTPVESSIPTVFPVQKSIYHRDWTDLNKNGKKDIYEDVKQPINKRVEDLLGQMTPDEKTAQCVTLYGYPAVLKDKLPTLEWKKSLWMQGVGNIDEQLNGNFRAEKDERYSWPPSSHVEAMNEIQRFFIEQTRLGVPADFTNEGIKGATGYRTTNFPIPLGLGSTWDLDLAHRVGEITGLENHLMGFTNVYAPILDVLRDQRWGRSEECYGEDPWLVAQFGIQVTRGIQSMGSASTSKHFAVYSFNKGAREGDARTDPHANPREVEEIALYPFRQVIQKAHLLGVMASYNDYDGEPVIASKHFLIDKLRKEFGFQGYVVSDSEAVEYVKTKHGVAKNIDDAVRKVMEAGLNVRTNFTDPKEFLEPLRRVVKSGALPMKVLDQRVREILHYKFVMGLFDTPYRAEQTAADKLIASPEHLAVALKAARESLVLLKNQNNVLPLTKSIKSIAIVGPNAKNVDWVLKRYGSTHVVPTNIFDSIKSAVGSGTVVNYAQGCSITDKGFPESELDMPELSSEEKAGIDEAVREAQKSDQVIAVVGDSNRTSGESRSRTSLELPGRQLDLLKALAATGKPMVVVVVSGRPMTINWVEHHVPGIIYAFCPGQFSGQAIAEVLFGDVNPTGKLNCTFPKSIGQIPFNFPTKPHANIEGAKPYAGVSGALYPFGYGLSYTSYEYKHLSVLPEHPKKGQSVTVTFDVTNTGKMAGSEVVQLYTRQTVSSVTTYEKNLRGFKRVDLLPGQTRTVSLSLSPEELEIYSIRNRWEVEPGAFRVMIGASSEDIRLKGEFVYGE